MKNNEKDNTIKLCHVAKAVVDCITDISDEHILNEFIEDGRNLKDEAIGIKNMMLKTINKHKMDKNLIHYASENLETYSLNWIPLCKADKEISLLLAKTILCKNTKTLYGQVDQINDDFFEQKAIFLAALFTHANTLNNASPAALCAFVSEFISELNCKPEELLYVLLNSQNELAREYTQTFINNNQDFSLELILYSVYEGLDWLNQNRSAFICHGY